MNYNKKTVYDIDVVGKKVLLRCDFNVPQDKATGEQAAEVCGFIRATIRAMYGARIARSVTIQYGGSMNPANAAELLGHEDIDGGLIGGASLDAGKFMDIVNAANQG